MERNDVKEYLKKRLERLKKENPNSEKRLAAVKAKIDRALKDPTIECAAGNDHNFVFLFVADSSDVALYYFECEKCGEVVQTKYVRAADDPMCENP